MLQAAKFALEALSEALAQEVKAFNVRVAIVEPGIMRPAAHRCADNGKAMVWSANLLGTSVSDWPSQ